MKNQNGKSEQWTTLIWNVLRICLHGGTEMLLTCLFVVVKLVRNVLPSFILFKWISNQINGTANNASVPYHCCWINAFAVTWTRTSMMPSSVEIPFSLTAAKAKEKLLQMTPEKQNDHDETSIFFNGDRWRLVELTSKIFWKNDKIKHLTIILYLHLKSNYKVKNIKNETWMNLEKKKQNKWKKYAVYSDATEGIS